MMVVVVAAAALAAAAAAAYVFKRLKPQCLLHICDKIEVVHAIGSPPAIFQCLLFIGADSLVFIRVSWEVFLSKSVGKYNFTQFSFSSF